MNKIVLVPDSFKGTMSSQEICCIMKKEILSFFPQAQVLSVPVADGGEGSVCLLYTSLEKMRWPSWKQKRLPTHNNQKNEKTGFGRSFLCDESVKKGGEKISKVRKL